MSGKLKWGILGAGLIANDCVAPAILQSKNSELIAVYARQKERADSFARKFQAPNSYDDLEAFLANPEIEVVYISSPNARHYSDSLAAIKNKKHVFCEKPMCTSIEEALQLKDACQAAGVKFGLAFMFPFHPLSVLAKNRIKEGRIGEIILMKANFVFDLPACEKINPWRFQPELSGGGAIIEVGCHGIDILNYLSEKKVVSVSATADRPRMTPPSENVGIITAVYEDNSIGLITVANNAPGAGPYGANFEVHGTLGSIVGLGNLNRFPTGKLIFRDRSGKEEIINLPFNNTDFQVYIDEVDQFSGHILKNAPLYADLENGISNMKVIMAAYRSAGEKKTIILNPR